MATDAQPLPIAPVEILHSVDVIPADSEGHHGESYNYLDYLFAGDGLAARARSYLDTIETVVLHGPARAPDGVERIAGTAFEDSVLAYLKLRYRRIERFNPAIRTGRPYDVVWQEGDGAA
jgi:hypothetical protein